MTNCTLCKKRLNAGEVYRHLSRPYCEVCCIDLRMTRTRKTHHQYVRSIKTEYLQQGPRKFETDKQS